MAEDDEEFRSNQCNINKIFRPGFRNGKFSGRSPRAGASPQSPLRIGWAP